MPNFSEQRIRSSLDHDIVPETGLSGDYFNEMQWLIGIQDLAQTEARDAKTSTQIEFNKIIDEYWDRGILPVKTYTDRFKKKGYGPQEPTEKTKSRIEALDALVSRLNALLRENAPISQVLTEVKAAAQLIFETEYIAKNPNQFKFLKENYTESSS